MLIEKAIVHPTLPVVDLERAKKFYEEKIGLTVLRTDLSPGVMLKGSNGAMLYIYQRAATKADHTVASFEVDDVEATVKELKAKGVVFEEIDMPGLKTVDSIATMGPIKGAWFKDTEGNILAVTTYGK
jgi:predicted enzyme related to lactoylglutathione lyase